MGRAGNENTSSGGLEHKKPMLYMSGAKSKPFPSTAEINGVFCTSQRWEEKKISIKYSSFLCWALLQEQFEISKTVYVFSLCLLNSATIHTPKPPHNLETEPLRFCMGKSEDQAIQNLQRDAKIPESKINSNPTCLDEVNKILPSACPWQKPCIVYKKLMKCYN